MATRFGDFLAGFFELEKERKQMKHDFLKQLFFSMIQFDPIC